jgi:hypothetical protein
MASMDRREHCRDMLGVLGEDHGRGRRAVVCS